MKPVNHSGRPLLRVRDLQVSFRGDKQTMTRAVKCVSFDIPHNTTVALVGESGSGKSVTALTVLGLLPKENASIAATSFIEFEGRNLLAMSPEQRRAMCGREISMIFQESMTSLNPVVTVGAQIGEVLRLHMCMNAKQAQNRTIALLEEVGIDSPLDRIDAYPNQLSGGQQQRVMIAMAIACAPKLLIADEPTTALDVTIQKQIIELIESLRKKHRISVLFITHDLALVGEIADQVIVMRDGEVRENGPVRQIFEDPQDPYTKALLMCRPSLDRRPWRLPVISDYMHGGVEPDLREHPRGCSGQEETILDVRHIGKNFFVRDGFFGKKEFKAVQDVSFTLPRGKTLGVVGESGSGKTTLGLTLMRLHKATTGQVIFDGQDIFCMPRKDFLSYKRRIQIIFQNHHASLNQRFTIGQILLEPMRIHQLFGNDDIRVDMAMQMLKKVGLPAQAYHRYPHQFSGGQLQRIAIARCLTMQPEILVCDESVSSLDVSVQAQVLNLLQDLQEEFNISYIFISHDLAVVKYLADEVMVMHQGKVVEMAQADAVYGDPQHPYTKQLIGAIPGGWGAQRIRT